MDTIKLPDGYNGDFVECECKPIEKDGDNYKLRVKGSYLIRWCTRQQWEAAILEENKYLEVKYIPYLIDAKENNIISDFC